MKNSLLVVFAFVTILFTQTNVFAAGGEGALRLGVVAGHVGLLKDVGAASGNAVGIGGYLGYNASDDMTLDITYTSSGHTNLNHTSFTLGVSYTIAVYDQLHTFLSGGVDFTQHNMTNYNLTSNGFGLYFGGGVDFEVGPKFLLGLQALYHNMFDTTVNPSGVGERKAIQDYATVMVRAAYLLGGKSGSW